MGSNLPLHKHALSIYLRQTAVHTARWCHRWNITTQWKNTPLSYFLYNFCHVKKWAAIHYCISIPLHLFVKHHSTLQLADAADEIEQKEMSIAKQHNERIPHCLTFMHFLPKMDSNLPLHKHTLSIYLWQITVQCSLLMPSMKYNKRRWVSMQNNTIEEYLIFTYFL